MKFFQIKKTDIIRCRINNWPLIGLNIFIQMIGSFTGCRTCHGRILSIPSNYELWWFIPSIRLALSLSPIKCELVPNSITPPKSIRNKILSEIFLSKIVRCPLLPSMMNNSICDLHQTTQNQFSMIFSHSIWTTIFFFLHLDTLDRFAKDIDTRMMWSLIHKYFRSNNLRLFQWLVDIRRNYPVNVTKKTAIQVNQLLKKALLVKSESQLSFVSTPLLF